MLFGKTKVLPLTVAASRELERLENIRRQFVVLAEIKVAVSAVVVEAVKRRRQIKSAFAAAVNALCALGVALIAIPVTAVAYVLNERVKAGQERGKRLREPLEARSNRFN